MTRYKVFVWAFMLASVFAKGWAQDYRQKVENFCLPVMDIYTVNSEEPTCDYVTHPKGAMGESIANATKVPARMYMTMLADTLYDSGEYEKDQSGLTIRIRGNTSAYGVKKPYKLKLQKKKDLLLRGDNDTYKDKDWLLMPLSIYTITGLKVNELIGMPYTPRYRFVNVFINDNYRGIYMLMESIKRNEKCRIDVDEDGFIVELDAYWWNEEVYFPTIMHTYNGKGYKYTFKYPDADDVDEDIISHIQDKINEMEKSMAEGTYPDVIDVETFAKWLLGHDILGTWDSGGSNRFFAKYDDGAFSKIFIPCMWDFDSMAKMDYEWARIHQDDIYYKMLFQSTNTEFTETYLDLWENLSHDIFTEINQYFDNITRTDEWDAVEKSLLLDQKRWNYNDCTLAEDADNVCKWLNDRQKWMNETINDIKVGDAGTVHNFVYSIGGVFQCKYKDFLRLPRGIYIVNRKKVFIK